MAKMIPVAIWTHPADSITCELCWSLLGVYQGMVFIIGSPEYWGAMGIFHPNCRFEYLYGAIPLSDYKEPPPLTTAIPADSSTWDIAFNSFVPIAALGERRDRIAARPIKRQQGALQEGGYVYTPERLQEAKQRLRQFKKKGDWSFEKIYDNLVRTFGICGIIAWNEG